MTSQIRWTHPRQLIGNRGVEQTGPTERFSTVPGEEVACSYKPLLSRSLDTVRAIVDLPAPADPFSQKMLGIPVSMTHSLISCNTSVRVPSKQSGSSCLFSALNAAWDARDRAGKIVVPRLVS